MSNQFLNATEYANSMLLLAKNFMVMGRLVDGKFKNQVTDENGLVINVKRPPRFVAGSGAALQTQDIVTGSVNIAVNQYTNVHLQVGDLESVQSFNSLMRNSAMRSAAQTIASQLDSYLGGQLTGFNGITTSGFSAGLNTPNPAKPIPTVQALKAAHTRLTENGVPLVDIAGVIQPIDNELITGAMLTNFTPEDNRTALERARVPVVDNIDWYEAQQTASYVTGTRGNGTVNGANQNVNYRNVKNTMVQTFNVNGLGAAATVAAGEVFTLAGVFAWDWRANGGSGAQLPYLQQFTVVNAATADGTGAAALTISPPIIVPGTNDGVDTKANTAFATASAAPAAAAVVTWLGAASTNIRVRAAWQKSSIQLVSARLQTPFTGVSSFATDPETGISLRYWRGSDINTGNHIHRWDCIYGASNLDAFMGTRVCGF